MLKQECRGDARPGGQAAGRAASLEEGPPDVLCLRQGKALPGTPEKMGSDILAIPGNDPGPARQDIVAVASGQVRCRARRRQTTQLFRANREPEVTRQRLQAGWGWSNFSIIAGTEPGQAGTDENNFKLWV